MVEVVGMEVVPYYLTLITITTCSRVSPFGVRIINIMMNENNGCKNDKAMRSKNDSSCSASSSDDIIFDQCVHELELNGYALLSLPTLLQSDSSSIIARAFKTARRGLDAISDDVDVPIIDPTSDSGSWTGYHNAASDNGRYNEYREGFVFSNGDMFDMKNIGGETSINFENEMSNLFRIMHDNVANGVLRAIERRLELPNLYFRDEFGPTDNSSQWHMKRYNIYVNDQKHTIIDKEEGASNESTTTSSKSESKEANIFLPVHTDPSLISVVILDQIGRNEGGQGLQVYHPTNTKTQINKSGTYKEIPHHGHDVAIVFVGSVLSFLTKGHIFAAAKHRVVNWTSSGYTYDSSNARMAATLFVRPNPSSIMKPIPSPHLQQLIDNVSMKKKKNHPTFRVWNARVAKNYMKKRESLH